MFKKIGSLLLTLSLIACLGVTVFADVQWFGQERYVHGTGKEVNNIKYCTAANDVEALVIASKGGISNYRILSEYYGLPVVEIMDYAFDCNWYLKSVSIPNTVRVIGDSAFGSCKDLKSVTLPSGLEEIGEYAFAGTGLTAITIPASVKTLGRFAFNLCSNLSALTIEPGNCHYIGSYAFQIREYRGPVKEHGVASADRDRHRRQCVLCLQRAGNVPRPRREGDRQRSLPL